MSQEPLKKAIAANIVQTMGTGQALPNGLFQIPVGKMLSQVQYLQEHVLPQAKEKLGETSESYLFYKSLVDSLLWAINIQSRFDHLSTKYNRERYMGEILKQNRDQLEAELLKFTTMEQLYGNMANEFYLNTIAGNQNKTTQQ